jgi:hypothetical protein
MNGEPEDDEAGPETDSDGRGKARIAGARAAGSHAHGAHAIVPSTLRGPRARASRGKIKESLSGDVFDAQPPDKSHLNRR